jgi:hypothetical protein
MLTWSRSVVDTILGKVPGKISRLDTATHGDGRGFQRSPRVNAPRVRRERDDGRLIKPIGPSATGDQRSRRSVFGACLGDGGRESSSRLLKKSVRLRDKGGRGDFLRVDGAHF